MDRLLRILADLVRGLAALLGEHRRDWVHALLAETDDQPTRAARLAWLGGGLWLATREVLRSRLIQASAFAAGAVGLVRISWPGAATNSATPVNRMYVVGTLILLAGLPPLVRRYAGPVRPGWAPPAIRAGGYAVLLALVAATAVQQRIGSQLGRYFPVIPPVWAMDAGYLLIFAGYIAGLLVLTSRRVRFTRRVLPTALGIGALTAGVLYPLAPFGIGDTAEAAARSLHGGPVVVAGDLTLACFALAALAVPLAVHASATRLADRDTRAAGLAPARQVRAAALGCFAAACVAGFVLAAVTSWWLLLLGAAAVAAAWTYTGGSRPYGYHGLGEVAVFAFFGVAAVAGTAYVQMGRLTWLALAASVPVGLLSCALLVINNLRDIPSDEVAGKRTLAVLIGDHRTRVLYGGCLLVPFGMLVVIAFARPLALLALTTLPLALPPLRAVRAGAQGPALIGALGQTGRLQLAFGLLLTIGLAVTI